MFNSINKLDNEYPKDISYEDLINYHLNPIVPKFKNSNLGQIPQEKNYYEYPRTQQNEVILQPAKNLQAHRTLKGFITNGEN